jgi:hypothetical protein
MNSKTCDTINLKGTSAKLNTENNVNPAMIRKYLFFRLNSTIIISGMKIPFNIPKLPMLIKGSLMIGVAK